MGQISVIDPRTSRTEQITHLLADRAQMRILHMVTGDPNRTPTFFDFLKPGLLGVIGGLDCSSDPKTLVKQCPGVETWLHGNIQPQITRTWLALAGPGVVHRGITNSVWSDHTDVRPTLLAALGLRDQYVHDGRVLTEALKNDEGRSNDEAFARLQRVFKQINAPVAQLGLATARATTVAMKSGSPSDDDRYARVNRQILSIAAERDELASHIEAVLEGVAFHDRAFDAEQGERLITQANALLEQADSLTGGGDN